jgi:hypothetical protein
MGTLRPTVPSAEEPEKPEQEPEPKRGNEVSGPSVTGTVGTARDGLIRRRPLIVRLEINEF